MEGLGLHSVLGVESPDPALSMMGAMGLALSAGTALIVDLEGGIRTTRSLADFEEAGPSLAELSPGRRGVALLSGSGAGTDLTRRLILDLATAWPAVVVRCRPGQHQGPIVPLRAMMPGLLASQESRPVVWQPWGSRHRPPGPGPVLPHLPSHLVRSLLIGRPSRKSRWIRAWERIWEMPWA